VKLIDLEPAWLTPDVFIFRNPTGGKDWLTCKRVLMTMHEQYELIYEKNPQYVGSTVVSSKPDCAWKFEGNDFNTMTVTPSIDASSSGNWHGFITNGEIK
jgi:hypothetical protein